MDETEYGSKPGIVAPTEKAHDSKAIAIQIAHLTLAGHVVYKGQFGDFLVCKYGLSRYCQDLAELQVFARQLGIKK